MVRSHQVAIAADDDELLQAAHSLPNLVSPVDRPDVSPSKFFASAPVKSQMQPSFKGITLSENKASSTPVHRKLKPLFKPPALQIAMELSHPHSSSVMLLQPTALLHRPATSRYNTSRFSKARYSAYVSDIYSSYLRLKYDPESTVTLTLSDVSNRGYIPSHSDSKSSGSMSIPFRITPSRLLKMDADNTASQTSSDELSNFGVNAPGVDHSAGSSDHTNNVPTLSLDLPISNSYSAVTQDMATHDVVTQDVKSSNVGGKRTSKISYKSRGKTFARSQSRLKDLRLNSHSFKFCWKDGNTCQCLSGVVGQSVNPKGRVSKGRETKSGRHQEPNKPDGSLIEQDLDKFYRNKLLTRPMTCNERRWRQPITNRSGKL